MCQRCVNFYWGREPERCQTHSKDGTDLMHGYSLTCDMLLVLDGSVRYKAGGHLPGQHNLHLGVTFSKGRNHRVSSEPPAIRQPQFTFSCRGAGSHSGFHSESLLQSAWHLFTKTLESVCWYLQNRCWDFNVDFIKSIDQVGSNCHLYNIESSNPKLTISPFI